MFIYPENLKAKPMLWLWELRDIGIIGVSFLLSVLALAQGVGMPPLVITVLYAFLAIRVDGSSIIMNGGWTRDQKGKDHAPAASVHPAAHGDPAHHSSWRDHCPGGNDFLPGPSGQPHGPV